MLAVATASINLYLDQYYVPQGLLLNDQVSVVWVDQKYMPIFTWQLQSAITREHHMTDH